MGRLLIPLFALAVIALAHVQDEQHRAKRGAPSTFMRRWTMPVPYRILNDFTEEQKAVIRAGIATIVEKTCIDFVEDPSDNFMMQYVLTGGTCASTVGDSRRVFERNHNVSLSAGCAAGLGNVQHETAHALGIGHTHSRADRDDYLTVDMTNIWEGKEKNFAKLEQRYSPDYGIPFEFGSRMMYPPDNYGTLMTPLEDGYRSSMNTAPEFTFYDWKILNTHYNCSGSYSTICPEKIGCKNGGYEHPRDCTRCFCGDFHDGKLCEIERDVIELSDGDEDEQIFNKTGEIDLTGLDGRNWANYHVELHVIKAPENSRIRVTIENQRTVTEIEGHRVAFLEDCPNRTCEKAGIEIADGDMQLTGKKFCCSETEATSFVSKGNLIGYRAYTHKGTTFQSKVTFKVEQ